MHMMFKILKCKPNVSNFKNQNYENIRSDLLLSGELFEDPYFPPTKSSIGSLDNYSDIDNIIWKRPKDIFEKPCLCMPSQNHLGAKAGCRSSLWVVSACSVLAGVPELFHRVIPNPSAQEWVDEEDTSVYRGIFHFHFWHFGQWINVVVDDMLPTVDDQLIFTSSSQPGELWMSLLEKAYAKLHGSYQGLEFGHLSDALVDFTGGVAETFDLHVDGNESNDDLSHLMETITKELNDHSLVCLKLNVRSDDSVSERNELGLYRGDVYQVTSTKHMALGETRLQHIFSNRNRIPMLRLRNTHGKTGDSSFEFQSSPGSDKGSETYAYSLNKLSRLRSRNPKWAQVKETELYRMGLSYQEGNEFWMPLDDIIVFDEIIFIHFYTNNAFSLLQRWKESEFVGHWTQGLKGTSTDRSGGCMEYQDTFLRNPQYLLDIAVPDQMSIIQLLQWVGDDQNKFISPEPLPLLIGFCMIKVEENRKYRLNNLLDFCPTVVTVYPVRKRQIFYRGSLSPGRYIIIPYTYKPGEMGGFLIRVFSQSKINMSAYYLFNHCTSLDRRSLKRDKPRHLWPRFFFSYPTLTTAVVVKSLSCENGKKEKDVWIQLKCEKENVKTNVSHSSEAVWNMSFIFYRSKPEKAITVKLFSRRWHFFKKLLGQADLPAPLNRCLSPLQLILRDKVGEPTLFCLTIQILTDDSILST